jgi:peptidylprolyl isomerase
MGRTILIMVLFILTASCSPAKTSTPVETVAATVAPAPTLDAFSPASPESTAEPYVLEGALTTASGLQYLELTAGDGRAPEAGDLVSMNFIGTLPDGTEFANSSASGEPVTVVYGRKQLLPGWEEGLGLMKAGGKIKLVLPPDLAFGEQGYREIPPNSQVILEIELLSVEKPPQPTSVATDKLETSASGLKYSDLTIGEGTQAITNSIVTTGYTVWVQGETPEFVARSEDGQPVTFVIGRGDQVFPGWEEGVRNMKVGGKRYLLIPPDLAFGEQATGNIPANATLIMEIELLEVREPVTQTEVSPDQYTTTESGLKYYDIVVGDGATPSQGQVVTVHYTGWLEDGTVFDSSVERGEPFTFALGVGGVIPGWDEGLASMKVGGKRQLMVPADLAYGEQGSGGVIPPGATLIFDVELISVEP